MLLLVEDIQFYVANRVINHISFAIFESDEVTLIFQDQKYGELMQTRTASRIMSYKGCNKKTSMSIVLVNGRLIKITVAMKVALIRSTASTLGRDRLGYCLQRSSDGDAPRRVNNLRHDPRLLDVCSLHGIHARTNRSIQ
jgi:hypothetical protein